MDSTDPVVASLRSAVQAAPSDIPLRRHLAALLAENALSDEAILHAAAALHAAPRDEDSRALMRRLLEQTAFEPGTAPASAGQGHPNGASPLGAFTAGLSASVPLSARPPLTTPLARRPIDRAYDAQPRATRPAPQSSAEPADEGRTAATAIVRAQEQALLAAVSAAGNAHQQVGSNIADRPEAVPSAPASAPDDLDEATESSEADESVGFVPDARWSAAAVRDSQTTDDAEQSRRRRVREREQVHVTLADVGGMGSAKERIEAAVLAPVRHPELLRLYRQSLTGGVLLYGPPGCGKTFLARAVAGELGARFVDGRVRDILEPAGDIDAGDIGEIFDAARAQAPVLLLLGDVEVLGRAPSVQAERAMARIIAELDSGDLTDSGVYVLATTCAPWHVPDELRRSGRLGRPLLVLPPDQRAREAVLRQELARVGGAGTGGAADTTVDLPLAEVSLRTEGYSCTDLEWLCTLAASAAARDGRQICEQDLRANVPRIAPSTEQWMAQAAGVAAERLDDPFYRELREYLRARPG